MAALTTAALVRAAGALALEPTARRFERAVAHPRHAQDRVLAQLVSATADTAYGRSVGLRDDDDYAAFARRVPIVKYEQLEPWIARQKERGGRVISPQSAALYEKTSGSSGGKKYIPYTPALMRSFHRMIFVWLHDLLRHGPAFRTGKVFFSISQPFHSPETTGDGTRVGMDDDLDYISPLTRLLIGSRFVNPPGIARLRNPAGYRRVLACALLAEHDLEIISIWNPTYLTTLLDYIATHRDALLGDLRRQTITVEDRRFHLAPIAAERAALLAAGAPWPQIWPALKLISCWTDGTAAYFAERLYREFPGVAIQGKGLLATEAPMTVPLIGAAAPVPMVDEVLFELEDEAGAIHRLHDAKLGASYQLIISQRSGLLRYRIGDRVEIVGHHRATPCLRFLGRAGDVSDLVGEKLNAEFVHAALTRVFAARDSFSFLVPVRREGEPSYYCCVTTAPTTAASAAALEAELATAHHYDQARKLDQLGPVRITVASHARDAYYDHHMSRGMKWGDIKFSPLLKTADDGLMRRLGVLAA